MGRLIFVIDQKVLLIFERGGGGGGGGGASNVLILGHYTVSIWAWVGSREKN